MVAVSILFCLPEAVAGNVHAGSQVAVFDTIASGSSTMTRSRRALVRISGWRRHRQHRLVLPKVTVLQ